MDFKFLTFGVCPSLSPILSAFLLNGRSPLHALLSYVTFSLLLFYLTIELLDLNVTNNNGQQGDFWMAGTSILGNLIIVVTVGHN